ncbi:MAG: class I SAM-dependent methyltransferase [Saprospiraceae bacterium]
MNIKEAYNSWANQYDSNVNKTRDLEGISLRKMLKEVNFGNCLEIGCGTGKNTEWLSTQCSALLAIDFSDEMLAKAKSKIGSHHVEFLKADITMDWTFTYKKFDLVVFSLVLEHVEHLDMVFKKVADVVNIGGYVYIGELHPFKQYSGSKASFETTSGKQFLTCFNHHVSDFTIAAGNNGFEITFINEWFDNDDRYTIPRILTLLLRKRI